MAGIGNEILFTLDNFQNAKLLSTRETVAQQLINLFLMRPGNLPSLPHVGINIEQYLYRLQGDFDPDEIKQKLYNQCSELLSYISLGEIQIFITIYKGQDVLIAAIPIVGIDDGATLLLGFTKTNNDVSVSFQYKDITAALNN